MTTVLMHRQQLHFHPPSFLCPAPCIFPEDFLQPPTAAQRPADGSLHTALPQSSTGTAQQRCRATQQGPHAAMEGVTCPYPTATYSLGESRGNRGSRKIMECVSSICDRKLKGLHRTSYTPRRLLFGKGRLTSIGYVKAYLCSGIPETSRYF